MRELARIDATVAATLRTISANVEAGIAADDSLALALISPAEIRLMEAFLREGLDPIQQHPIGYYHADFYFPQERLCVEVDGKHHKDRAPQDRARDRALWKKGIKTLRIPAGHVLMDADACARAVRYALDQLAVRNLDG